MKRTLLIIPLLFWVNSSKSQVQDSTIYSSIESIKSDDLKEIVYTLASPKMEGRGVGTEGIRKAAIYITKFFQVNSIAYLPPLKGYEQRVDYSFHRLEKPIVRIGKVNCAVDADYIGATSTFSSDRAFGVIVVQNTSLEYIQKLDFKDKAILILTPDIFFVKKPLYDLLIKKGCRGVILCNPYNKKEFNDLSRIYSTKGDKKREKYKVSFSGSILKTDSLTQSLRFKNYYISTLVVPPGAVSRALGIDIKTIINKLNTKEADSTLFKKAKIEISIKQDLEEETHESDNVLGFIEGGDRKDEVIVISAHYDHLGIEDGRTMYGADDNASGVAAVMEIAQAYSIAIKKGFKPKRSIIFAAFTAEESGLWGSNFFVNKVDSLKLKPIVNLNVDMIGRGEDSRMELNSKVKKVYATAERRDSLLIRKIKQIHLGEDTLRLDYSSRDKYSSDQASFMHKGISAVLFFRGLHSDYHTEHDIPEKLDYKTMEKVTRLIFKLSLEYTMDK